VADLTPEQADFFNRAERVFGHGRLSAAIEDAKEDVIKRNQTGGIVKGGNPVIGFVPEKRAKPAVESDK
jgi:hypothetical protein